MNTELKKSLEESRYIKRPMKADMSNSNLYRMLAKPEQNVKLIHSLETLEDCTFGGFRGGRQGAEPLPEERLKQCKMSISTERSHLGTSSLKVAAPTFFESVYAHWTTVTIDTHDADWRDYNRLSFWVYADCPGRNNVLLKTALFNNGEKIYPNTKYNEGASHFNVKNGVWTRVIWEIDNIPRDKVNRIEFIHTLHSPQPGMEDMTVLYYNQLEISRVDADMAEGWDTGDNIAFCHSGYLPEDPKIALTQNSKADKFQLINWETGKPAYTGTVVTKTADIGTFDTLDFSDLKTPGKYIIKVGSRETKPFYIGANVWDSAIWKMVNFYFCERCGFDVPNSHVACHMDCFGVHPDGRKICTAGGWHDAGDLSQYIHNTSDSAMSLLEMAANKKHRDPELYERLLEEARWGLGWIMRTRFGDGYRAYNTAINSWTNNIVGDEDGFIFKAANSPSENSFCATLEAMGYVAFREDDPEYAYGCLKCAREDFVFAEATFVEKGGDKTFTGAGNIGNAAMELFLATGETEYLDKAIAYADTVMACQQKTFTDWDIPMRGFFWAEPGSDVPVLGVNVGRWRGVTLLSRLERFAPPSRKDPAWRNALALFAEHMKAIAKYCDPYDLIPGGIQKDNDPAERDTEIKKDLHDCLVKGIRLSDKYYLRRFRAVVEAFKAHRGFFSDVSYQSKAMAVTALALGDKELAALARKQLGWLVGFNPFCRSYMYGEGYDFPEMFTEFSMDIVGQLPVGIETNEDRDLPYMPHTNHPTYLELHVASTQSLLLALADLV